MSTGKWNWVRGLEGGPRFENVGILSDGSLHNPNGYPDDEVRRAVEAAIKRRHERRSAAAQKAAATRALRREKELYALVDRIRAGHVFVARNDCALCGKGLSDPESRNRGIGPECWQDVLRHLMAHTVEGVG